VGREASGIVCALAIACGSAEQPAAADSSTTEPSIDASSESGSSSSSDSSGDTGEDVPPETALVTHAFGRVELAPQTDDASQCVSWTLHNEQAIYAQAVLVSNEGYFHHSNWFVVPESEFDGPDGYWTCDDRGYSELAAGTAGTVLFAQSTQSYVEEQRLSPGAVVKLPPRSRVVAGIHTLNTAPRRSSSRLWVTLEAVHPREVTTVVTPVAIQYRDLLIPASTEVRVTATCDFADPHMTATGAPIDMRLHYVLPHYHYLGNFFDVTVIGGELDGQSVFEVAGFDGQANGRTFDPPLHLPGATGLAATCGFDNWRTEDVVWGNGDGEMCVMMALVEADAKIGASVSSGDAVVDVRNGIQYREGDCTAIGVPKSPEQGMPTPEEIAAPLYLPPVDPDDAGIPPVPECRDANRDAMPENPITLTSLRETIFDASCTFSSCHGAGAAAGLDLHAEDLHAELMGHESTLDPGMPLVAPGDPEGSLLYRILADCEPMLDSGVVVSHMPKGAPTLLDGQVIAKLRAWIEAGAPND
jgi:hypothetical protein